MKYPELWNRFINEVYYAFIDNEHSIFKSNAQKNAIIAFSYDAEVNNGGHILFFECYGDKFSNSEVAEALLETTNERYASNFLSAAAHIYYNDTFGYMDKNENADTDPAEDFEYTAIKPTLPDLLVVYIYENREDIFL